MSPLTHFRMYCSNSYHKRNTQDTLKQAIYFNLQIPMNHQYLDRLISSLDVKVAWEALNNTFTVLPINKEYAKLYHSKIPQDYELCLSIW